MKNIIGVMICIGIAAAIMSPSPIIQVNIYKNGEKEEN